MSIFSRIKDAIFGKAAQAAPAPAAVDEAAAAAAAMAAAGQADANAADRAAAAAAAISEVDVEAILTDLASANPQKLNWRTSIVDLMKLVGMESSLAERKELAGELGYSGDMGDSASMNIWLHKQVMAQLAANGGKVPDSLLG